MTSLATIHTEVWLFIGAGVISLLAFGIFILAPTIGSFGRTWEKATAMLISLFVFAALVMMGVGLGALIIYKWPQISGWI
jgi:bacteriorhodopsin